jgi:hypothetical protein
MKHLSHFVLGFAVSWAVQHIATWIHYPTYSLHLVYIVLAAFVIDQYTSQAA